MIGVRSPTEAKNFSSSSEAHTTSYPVGTGGPFPGGKALPGMMLTTHPNLVLRSRMSRSYASSLHSRLHDGSRTALLLQQTCLLSRICSGQLMNGLSAQLQTLIFIIIKDVQSKDQL
jgi:hypothetical protein